MTRALLVLLASLCCSTAWGQYPIYPARPQPPAPWAYSSDLPFFPPPFYPGLGPYGYGPYGFGAPGYFSPFPYGGQSFIAPNPPSPYYVAPSGREYLEQARRKEQAKYSEVMLRHYLEK